MLYRRFFLPYYVLYFLRHLQFSAPEMSYLPPGWTLEQLQTATIDDIREIPEEVGDLTGCLRFLPLKQEIISPFNTDR